MQIPLNYQGLNQISVHVAACILAGIAPAAYEKIEKSDNMADLELINIYHSAVMRICDAILDNQFLLRQHIGGDGNTDIHKTMLKTAQVRAWAKHYNVGTGYFTGGNDFAALLDKNDPWYSPRLNAAVLAWQAGRGGEIKGKTQKAVAAWLIKHAKKLGLQSILAGAQRELNNIAYVAAPDSE